MKFSRLYCNRPQVFPAIRFNDGLNVVLGEIRDPANLNRDTHNLGKTTIANLLDFCLLKARHKSFFLFKHGALFDNFVFFLEIRLAPGCFITIRRSISEPSKVSFCYTTESKDDLVDWPAQEWDHWCVAFDASKELLEARLGFSKATRWSFRKPLGYALRLQDDYRDVFQLGKFRGPHGDWKPFLAELVGLDGELVQRAYRLAAEAEEVARSISELEPQLAGLADSPDRLVGMILLRSREVEALESRLERFDFKLPDEGVSEELVNQIEAQIAVHNERRYHLQMSLQVIDRTLGETIRFDLGNIERVFAESKVYFGDQLKREYSDLLVFLESISTERAELIKAERLEIQAELKKIEVALEDLNARRLSALAVLREAKSLAKYREHMARLVELKATLAILERQRAQMGSLTELRHRHSALKLKRGETIQSVEANLTQSSESDSVYRRIRVDFSEVVKAVLDRAAVLSCTLNKEGNIEFQAEILDESGTATSADDGHTYRKLLCVAFDIAVFSAYLDKKFIHFVFHDGVFESLDDRKKRCLLTEMRARGSKGLQQIITVIDSDLPLDENGNRMEFEAGEVIRLLHDQGDDGRLFRMRAW